MQPQDTVSTPKYTCCYYHHKFGKKAKQCRPPCDFKVTVNNIASKQDNLLFICDKNSGRRFLVDTGAEVSVLPATNIDTRTKPCGQALQAANGRTIRTHGTRIVPI